MRKAADPVRGGAAHSQKRSVEELAKKIATWLASVPQAAATPLEPLVRAFVEWCQVHRNGSPNAFYLRVDRFCKDVEALALPPPQPTTTPIRAHREGCPNNLRTPVDRCECGGRDFLPDAALPPPQEPARPFPDELRELNEWRHFRGFLQSHGWPTPTPSNASAPPPPQEPPADFSKLTRLEVIDETGRLLSRWNVAVEPRFQDQGRMLKLFIEARASALAAVPPPESEK